MDDPRKTAREYLQRGTATLDQLWARYWGNGGSAGPVEFEAYLYAAQDPPAQELEILGWALTEIITDIPG